VTLIIIIIALIVIGFIWITLRDLRDPIFRIANEMIDETFNTERTKYIKKEYKEDLKVTILKEILEIKADANPILKNREKLVESVLVKAKYGVLVADRTEGKALPGLRGKTIISGELKNHLVELAKKDDAVKEVVSIIHENNEEVSNEIIQIMCGVHYWGFSLKAAVFNGVRFYLKDYDKFYKLKELNFENDWYELFEEAMFVFEEAILREEIGLVEIFEPLEMLKYNHYQRLVLDGEKYPHLKWKELFERDEAAN